MLIMYMIRHLINEFYVMLIKNREPRPRKKIHFDSTENDTLENNQFCTNLFNDQQI